jgi:tetratricopeptide (TPR) repeat protein
MRTQKTVFALSIICVFLFSGCTAMTVTREVQSGRSALRVGNPKAAVSHFEAAASLDPDYVANYSSLEVGVWSYLGRAQYEAGDKARALDSFKRARREAEGDYFARTYLGLLMAQNGGREAGKKELEAGLRGLHEWLETIPARVEGGHYWDPSMTLRKTIVRTLDLLKAEKVPWTQVDENVRWLGQEFDDEPEKVRRDRRHDLESGSDRDSKQ